MSKTTPSSERPEVEFWLELASNYTYLSVMRIEQEALRYGVRVRWRPFLLGPIFNALGMETSPFVLQKEKGAYMWQDMRRLCTKYGIGWVRPSRFPRSSLLPARIAIEAAEEPWIAEFCKRIMVRNFVQDFNIDRPDDVAPILTEMGLPAAAIIANASREHAKEKLRAQTSLARARGIFGSPTFFVGDEMFWGNDRLEDAFAFASS